MFEDERFMAYACEVEQGGLVVVNVYWVFDDVGAQIFGLSIGYARLDPRPGHPNGEGTRVVVPSVICRCQGTLTEVGPAKFSSPYH